MQIEIKDFLSDFLFLKIRRITYFITFIFSLIQIFISSFDINILIILFLINLISIINLEITLQRDKLLFYLIPSLLVIFVNLFYLLFPLYIKTFLGGSILDNLELGIKSFYISILYVIVTSLCFSFFVKKTNFSNRDDLNRPLLTKLNVFEYLNVKSSIIIFLVLFSIKLYLFFYQNSFVIHEEFGNIFLKFLFGFDQFFYLPIILMFNLYYLNRITKFFFINFLVLNILLSIFFAISTNSRTEIFQMITIIFFCYFFFFLQGKIKINGIKFIFILFLLILFSFIFENISKKLLKVRGIQYETSPIELFKITSGLSDVNYKILDINTDQNLEYIYTGHNVLDRFTPIKYLDKALYDSSYFGFSDYEDFSKFSRFKMLSLFPQNLINIFAKDYKKSEYKVAIGSKIERLAYQRFGGDLNKGSYIVELLLITNSYILTFVLVALIYLTFFFIVSFFQKVNNDKIIFSPIILLFVFEILYASQSDSLAYFITFFFRTPIEMILLINILYIFNSKDKYKY